MLKFHRPLSRTGSLLLPVLFSLEQLVTGFRLGGDVHVSQVVMLCWEGGKGHGSGFNILFWLFDPNSIQLLYLLAGCWWSAYM